MRPVRFRETSAGGVVFAGDCVLLVLKRYSGAWVMPKGHVEPGEELWEAALREVREEAGVEGRVLAYVGVTQYQFPVKGSQTWFAKTVHWYLMEAASTRVQPEQTFRTAGFVALSIARERLSFANDRRILKRAADLWRRYTRVVPERMRQA